MAGGYCTGYDEGEGECANDVFHGWVSRVTLKW